MGAVELLALLTLIALLAPGVQSEGGPWSAPAVLGACSAPGAPAIVFPENAPKHGTGAGAIVWGSEPHCAGGPGARISLKNENAP